MRTDSGMPSTRKSRCKDLLAFCSASAGDRTRRGAQGASAVAGSFFRAATGSTTERQCFGKLAELGRRIVDFGKFRGHCFDFRSHFAQKVKEQRAPVEQVLYVEQRGSNSSLGQKSRASVQRFLAVLLQPRFKQFVFHRHPAQDRPIGITANRVFIGRTEHFTSFQTAAGAENHTGSAWIAHGVDRSEPADVAQGSDSYKMMPRHTSIVGYSAGCAKSDSTIRRLDFGFSADGFAEILGMRTHINHQNFHWK
jgi:hypothetical protein